MRLWLAPALVIALGSSALAQETAPGFLDADHWDGGRPDFVYTDLGVRLGPEDVAEEFRGLDLGNRLARIEALEIGWDDLSAAEIKDRKLAIGRLYGTSPFVKHRVWAANDLDDFLHARELPLPEALLRAQCYESMGNPWQSIRELERTARVFPNRARAWRELGRSRLELALQTWDRDGYERARQDFVRANQCADRTPRDLLGLASVLVAQGNARGVDALAPALLGEPSLAPGSILLAAWSAERSGRPQESERLFRAAIARLDDTGRPRTGRQLLVGLALRAPGSGLPPGLPTQCPGREVAPVSVLVLPEEAGGAGHPRLPASHQPRGGVPGRAADRRLQGDARLGPAGGVPRDPLDPFRAA